MHKPIPELYQESATHSRLTSALRSTKINRRIKALAIKLLLILSRIFLQINNYFCLTKAAIFYANISKLVDNI